MSSAETAAPLTTVRSAQPPNSPWIPIAVLLLGIGGAFALARSTLEREARALRSATDTAASLLRDQLRRELVAEVDALDAMARRWRRQSEAPTEQWISDARDISQRSPRFVRAIELVDAQQKIEWVVPTEGNERVVGIHAGFESRRLKALTTAIATGRLAISQPVDLLQDSGPGVVAYVPISNEAGAVAAAYSLQPWLESTQSRIAPRFAVAAHDGDRQITAVGQFSDGVTRSSQTLALVDLNLRLDVAPLPAAIQLHTSSLPYWLFGAGSALAALLALALALSRRSRSLARQLVGRSHPPTNPSDAGASRDELQRVIAQIPVSVWSAEVRSGEVGYRYYSPVIEQISGRPPEFYVAGRWLESVHPDDRERMQQVSDRVLRGRTDAASEDYRVVHADGSIRWVRDSMRAQPTPGGALRLDGVVTDITDRKQASVQRSAIARRVQHAQHLESLGRLAGGLAHDFNNLLVGILGNTERVIDELPEGSHARERLRAIDESAREAAKLCGQLLAYSGKGKFVVESLDLREVVNGVKQLIEVAAACSPKVDVAYEFDDRIGYVDADVAQMRQVILNLVTNAAESMGDHDGTIHVSVRAEDHESRDLADTQFTDVQSGSHVCLEVSDSGCGMDSEVLSRIYEPLFSTKFAGRGLGMSAVLGITRSHRGAIKVSSDPKTGTSVRILLPATGVIAKPTATRTPEPVAVATQQTPSTEASRFPDAAGKDNILVVDDESTVREVAKWILEDAGFAVEVASDGAEAVEIFRQRKDDFACVVLDLTMPNMDGEQAFHELRRIRSDVRVILSSGYSKAGTAHRFGDDLAGFLAKPYSAASLIEKVQGALAV